MKQIQINSKLISAALVVMFIAVSCQPDENLITPDLDLIYKVKSTELLLTENTWAFNDLAVDVQYEMRAIPLLANVADAEGMVQPGVYHSAEIFGNEDRQKFYTYQFSTTRINRDISDGIDYQGIANYKVVSPDKIFINPDSSPTVAYTYNFIEEEDLFVMTSDRLSNGVIGNIADRIIAHAILAGKPDDLANAFVDNILGNPSVQDSIQQLLYEIIHGNVDAIAESPEEISQKLASLIIQKLKSVDWEMVTYDKLVELLDQLKVDDPEQEAQLLAAQIADVIETNISQPDIYDAVLPIIQKFEDEALPKLVPAVAEVIYEAISNVFTEENIYNKIYPRWVSFSAIDSVTIDFIADTLATTITTHFFDNEALAIALEPFISTLRNTSTTKIPQLAQQIIDEKLIPLVDSINATFPALDLDPNWAAIKPVLSSALTVVKSSLADQTDAEAAAVLANNVIAIMHSAISVAADRAIHALQDIPADQAAQVIAAWSNNLVITAEPEIVAFLTEKLDQLVQLFNAEEVAEQISTRIYNKALDVFSEDNIYNTILPLMQQLSEINVESSAEIIADWLTDLGLIADNVTEEEVHEALTQIVSELIGNIDVDSASQELADLILQSELINSIDGNILKQVIELEIYKFLITLGRQINGIDHILFAIARE